MKLVITEKPSVAMALAKVVGTRERKDGYLEGKEYLVSWCVGHLIAFCDASEYDERYKNGDMKISQSYRTNGKGKSLTGQRSSSRF